MNRRIHQVCTIPALAALAFLTVAPCASAQEADHGPAIEIFGAHVDTIQSSAGHSQSYGLRGDYRFGPVWALEGSVSHLNEGFTNWFGDLSAKAYFVDTSRFEIYGLAGPGLFRVSAFGESRDQATVHAGFGAQIYVGEHAYLRPEVRGHWATNDLVFKNGLVDYALGIGWRF
ncbi:MAG TPA: outer membrane beta-barrel protein [Thermoanaerobaculia bacterium]|jgi:opacity protein-like surface antigen|nr:outer membrane beta-barrel protein [Thermoanaerobaculia bacterium]